MRRTADRWVLSVVSAVIASVLLALTWLAGAQEARLDGTTLRVATWGGSWKDTIHELIGKELEKRGAKIEYVIGNPRDSLNKLIAARGRDIPFDVMEVDDTIKSQLAEGQFLEELNFARLPNAADLERMQRDQYTVATSLSEEGIVYNAKKFQELGIPKPERHMDLFNPKLEGRVSFPDINVGMSINGIVGFAVAGGGDETNIDPGLELIKKLPVTSFYKSSVELATKFKSEDVWAAWWHAGWALRTRKSGVPTAMSFQKVKDKEGMLQIVWVGIPKGSKAARAAEVFINRYLDPEVQTELPKRVGVAPVKKAALAKLAEDPELKDVMRLDPAQIRNMYFIDWPKVNIAEWVNKWNRVIAR